MHPKPWLKSIAVLLALVSSWGGETVLAQQWELTWSDEFDQGAMLNDSYWRYEIGGGGWGNQELQNYTDARSKNVRIEDGLLIIEAHREDFFGSPYTSGRVTTQGKVSMQYGRLEARVQFPVGRGTWPAVWMMPEDSRYGGWPSSGEIDIVEHVGYEPDRVHANFHFASRNHQLNNNIGNGITLSTAETEFHVYAMEWTPTEIRMYVDGVMLLRYTNPDQGWDEWPFDQPFYLILNVAVGGTWGGLQGVDESAFPTQMKVDYVRFYRPIEVVPEVSLGLPADTTLEAGASLTLTAEIGANGDEVTSVAFYQEEGLLGVDATAPYEWTVDALAPGCYTVKARANTAGRWQGYSPTASVKVGSDCSQQSPYLMRATTLPGTIEAEYFDKGGAGTAYSDSDEANNGTFVRPNERVDISKVPSKGDGHYVGWIANREWMEYTIDVPEGGIYRADFLVASEASTGKIQLQLNGTDLGDELSFAPTGGHFTWRTFRLGGLNIPAGTHTLRVRARSTGFNLDRITFVLVSPTDVENTPLPGTIPLEIFPNPTSGTVHVTGPTDGTVELLDLLGRVVPVDVQRQGEGQWQMMIPSAGVYVVRWHGADRVYHKTLVVAP